MNLSDEQKKQKDKDQRTIRGMQMLGLSFPPDLRRSAEVIEELPIEHMLSIKAMFKEKYDVYNRIFEHLSERIVFPYCHICEKEQACYEDIPDGWGWHDANGSWYLMCDECQYRYAEKFNKIPEVVREPPQFSAEPDNTNTIKRIG